MQQDQEQEKLQAQRGVGTPPSPSACNVQRANTRSEYLSCNLSHPVGALPVTASERALPTVLAHFLFLDEVAWRSGDDGVMMSPDSAGGLGLCVVSPCLPVGRNLLAPVPRVDGSAEQVIRRRLPPMVGLLPSSWFSRTLNSGIRWLRCQPRNGVRDDGMCCEDRCARFGWLKQHCIAAPNLHK